MDELGIQKLISSGLDEEDAKKLGITCLSAPATAKLHTSFNEVPALHLPYFDPLGRPLSPFPEWPQFYRLRYLKELKDFKATAKGKKPQRYTQLPGSGTCAYFPKNFSWGPVLSSEDSIIITEGEFKAAKACKHGYPTIGLGGVYNFQSKALDVPLLPELARINWVKRKAYLIYDSDFKTNPNVCDALNLLAEKLFQRGALPHLVPLPNILDADKKTGLDDWLVANPADKLKDLIQDNAQPLTLARELLELNETVIYIKDPGLIVAKDQKMSIGQFKDLVYANIPVTEKTVKPNGEVSHVPAAAGPAWIRWPLRREARALTYRPGSPRYTDDHLYNTWPGWGCEPKKGSVQPFLKLIDHLFTGAPLEEKRWFLQWCAYPIQRPGTKLFSSVVMHGILHGTGKSMVGYSLKRIYGKNFAEIKQSDLHSSFNEWAENKQFVLGDDISGSDRRQDADILKKMITQQEFRLNKKHIPSYEVPDCINYYWTSNQPDSFFLEDHDRRFFIHEVPSRAGVLSEEFYTNYRTWLDEAGGPAIFDFLQRYDCTSFNPAAPAMRTMAKERMTEDVRSDLGSWVRYLRDDPDITLRLGQIALKGDLWSNKELLGLYDPSSSTRTTAHTLGRELRRAGFEQVLEGVPIKTSQTQDRYYIVRNHAKWRKASRAQIIAHLETKHR